MRKYTQSTCFWKDGNIEALPLACVVHGYTFKQLSFTTVLFTSQ